MNKLEHHAEMNRIDKEKMKNKIENFKENRRNIIKEIKSALDENEQKRNKEIKILEKQNKTLWDDSWVVIGRFKKQNIELMNLKEELQILKIENEDLKRKLRVIDDGDKPDIDNILNSQSIFGGGQTTKQSKLKQRMDEMFLEKERLNK